VTMRSARSCSRITRCILVFPLIPHLRLWRLRRKQRSTRLAAYRSGVGSSTDLTLAESQVLQAKDASTDAYSTALSAAATLALSTGTLGAAPP
jgi:hypothetical protein